MNPVKYIFFLIVLPYFSFCQDSINQKHDSISQHDFIRLDLNEITYDSLLNPFFELLADYEKNKDSKIHILHIGDSHIQADFFTESVRESFCEDDRFQIASRGFVFPYKAAQTNNPLNYSVQTTGSWKGFRSALQSHQSQWGLAGVTAITYDSTATITLSVSHLKQCSLYFQCLKIFYPNDDHQQSFVPYLKLKNGEKITESKIENGLIIFELDKPQDTITIAFQKKNPQQKQFIMQGIMLENEKKGIIYSASGVNGAEFSTYFRCKSFFSQLAQLNPQLLIISLGTNDAYQLNFDSTLFRANVHYMTDRIREVLPNTPLLFTTPGDSKRRRKYVNYENDKARNVLIDLGKDLGFAVWDFYKIMGGFKSIDKWVKHQLAQKDMLHLTQKGYRLQGELFYDALNKSYQRYKEKIRKIKNE
ncbi:MAG: GDSL-type esterase/lipase family protein [Flammeovirgaceae bacterium]